MQTLCRQSEYPLIQPVETKKNCDDQDIVSHGEAEIGDQEDDERSEQNVFSPNLSERDPLDTKSGLPPD